MPVRARQHDDSRSALLEELFGRGAVPDVLDQRLLRTADVAALFQVAPRTITDWAQRGRIPSVWTPGGHRRYPAGPIRDLLAKSGALAAAPAPAPDEPTSDPASEGDAR